MYSLDLVDIIKPENIVTIKLNDTALGSGDISYQLGLDAWTPAGYFYHLIGVTFTVTTSINAGNRIPGFAASGSGQNIYWRVRDESSVVASRTVKYCLNWPFGMSGIASGGFSSNASVAGVTNIKTCGLPLLILTSPDDISISVSAVLANDQITQAALRFLRSTRRGYGGPAQRFE